ncbi:MurR/RpiR family transcriptional regulator [Xanthobacter sp. V3C-3]|uniref:MurR/RpiR family transcriptional regulator n=1 Tax=Xanthobacter lutulentifluminis TaxID=3119935 RepID=UPI00372B6FC7
MISAKDSLVARITRHTGTLPPTERRLAEFLLDFPGNLPAYTATELAQAARVSNAAVTRFFQRLGYDSYNEARRQVRLEQKAGSPLMLLNEEGAPDGDALRAHLELSVQNLSETYRGLSGDMVDRVARAMLGARRVWFAGFRNNHSFAAYLRWQVFRVIETSILLPVAGETVAEYAVTLKKGDVLVVFALRRSTAASARLIARAVEAGAEVLCVVDSATENPGPATWLITCQAHAAGPLDNHVAVIALSHFLATRVVELSGRDGRRRMAAIEAAHDAFEEEL